VFLLLIIYHLRIFTPWIQSSEVKYWAGWSMTVITALNIIINLAILLYSSIKEVINECRKKKRMNEATKQVEERK